MAGQKVATLGGGCKVGLAFSEVALRTGWGDFGTSHDYLAYPGI